MDAESPKKTDNGLRVFARVKPHVHARIEALRDDYRKADGQPGATSDVLRAFVVDGECLMDRTLRAAMDAIGRERGIATRAETWRAIVEAGIAAMRGSK